MCGIVGYAGHQDCGALLLDGLQRLEYRGYDSAGLAIHDGTSLQRRRAQGKLAHLREAFAREPLQGTLGVAHTRWATHGAPSERNAHPHRSGTVVLVHNGIIENYTELRAVLETRGVTFESDTDTEILGHVIADGRARGLDLLGALRAALAQVRGSWAVVVADDAFPGELVAARHAAPLVVGLGEGENFVASDVPAILAHTRRVIFLEDGDVVQVRADGVQVEDAAGNPVVRPVQAIQWDPVSAEKQGYKHFMLKEIHEQPARVVDTLRGRIHPSDHSVDLGEIGLGDDLGLQVDRVVLLGCGTSWHAGLVGRYWLEAWGRLPVEVELASEYRYRNPVVTGRTLVVAVSQSGETADTLAAVREAQRLGARTLAVCNVIGSSLARLCERVLYTHAGPEIGVASTKAYTTQLAALALLALGLGRARGTLAPETSAQLAEALRRIPSLMEEALQLDEALRGWVTAVQGARSVLFLGRGTQYPTALEGALKLKEISYIHAEGYAAGEMKHGPIALIDSEMPVVVCAPHDPWLEKSLSNVQEVLARGGRVLLITSEDVPAGQLPAQAAVVRVPQADPAFYPLLTTVPLQLLAYGVADAKGTDVDQPRNLAKSVTVE
jgi:glucosamine--fructose-6-phosphate aminotransferase (isomerizing)